MPRFLQMVLAAAAVAVSLAGPAQAGGGDYVFAGGTPKQQKNVRAALEASAFDWGVVPATITIHVVRDVVSHATPGHIYLDARLLDSGRFAWATVQDEYAHQVDFFLFDDALRGRLNAELGGLDWCYGVAGLKHGEYGCERFASTLVWSYWPSRHNAYRPETAASESAAMKPTRFRALMAELLDARRGSSGA